MATQISELEEKQVLEPTKTLLEYLKKTKRSEELFDVPTKILLSVTFKLIPIVKNKVVKIKLPNGLKYDNEDICLFVKDLKKGDRNYEPSQVHFKELLASKGIDYISEVIPLKSLKLEYRPIEAKKNLCNKHDLFLADDRIFGNLPRTLGKDFSKKKRLPIKVNLTAKNLKEEINGAVNNAYMVITGKGSCCMAHVANSNMTAEQIAANILMSAKVLAEVIPGGDENIRNIYIKTEDSPSLPIFISKSGCDAQLPASKKKPEKPKPEEIDWSLRAKAYVTENNDIYLCSKNGKRKLLWGGTDFSNIPEKKRLLLQKKLNTLKKGKAAKGVLVGKNKKTKLKEKKNKRGKKMDESRPKKNEKQNGGLKEKKIKREDKIKGNKKEGKENGEIKTKDGINKKKKVIGDKKEGKENGEIKTKDGINKKKKVMGGKIKGDKKEKSSLKGKNKKIKESSTVKTENQIKEISKAEKNLKKKELKEKLVELKTSQKSVKKLKSK